MVGVVGAGVMAGGDETRGVVGDGLAGVPPDGEVGAFEGATETEPEIPRDGAPLEPDADGTGPTTGPPAEAAGAVAPWAGVGSDTEPSSTTPVTAEAVVARAAPGTAS